MSTGWITVVATMPLMPPLMNGKAALIKGVWRKSLVAAVASPIPLTGAMSQILGGRRGPDRDERAFNAQ
jgi:hypothetical protein